MEQAGPDYTKPISGPDRQDLVEAAPIRLEATAAERERLDRFLVRRLAGQPTARGEAMAISRSRLQRWISIGAVRVDGELRLASHRLKGFEAIEVWPQPLESEQAFRAEAIDLDVCYADDDFAIVDKPAGLVTHPAPGNWQGTLMNGLLHRFARSRDLPRAGIVHRLDRDTSGLLACALSERGFASLSRQLAERSIQRLYLAVMPMPPTRDGTIEAPIGRDPRDRLRMAVLADGQTGAKPARTDWTVLSEAGGMALVRCRLHTGRTHQIRVHFASIGCPLIGDAVYGGQTRRFARQALHAWRLRLDHPDGSGERSFIAGPPADFRALVDGLGLDLAAAGEGSLQSAHDVSPQRRPVTLAKEGRERN